MESPDLSGEHKSNMSHHEIQYTAQLVGMQKPGILVIQCDQDNTTQN